MILFTIVVAVVAIAWALVERRARRQCQRELAHERHGGVLRRADQHRVMVPRRPR
jgi:hypothetical protein